MVLKGKNGNIYESLFLDGWSGLILLLGFWSGLCKNWAVKFAIVSKLGRFSKKKNRLYLRNVSMYVSFSDHKQCIHYSGTRHINCFSVTSTSVSLLHFPFLLGKLYGTTSVTTEKIFLAIGCWWFNPNRPTGLCIFFLKRNKLQIIGKLVIRVLFFS